MTFQEGNNTTVGAAAIKEILPKQLVYESDQPNKNLFKKYCFPEKVDEPIFIVHLSGDIYLRRKATNYSYSNKSYEI